MPKALKDILKEEGADEALIANPTIAEVPDAPTLARRVIDLRKQNGELGEKLKNGGPLPDDDVALVAELRTRGRLPKAEAEYTLEGVTSPDGVAMPEQVQAALRKDAAEEGLTRAQFRSRANKVNADLAAARARQREELQATRTHFGDSYEVKMAEASAVMEKVGAPQEDREAVKGGRLTRARAEFYLNLGKQVGGGQRAVGDQDPSRGAAQPGKKEAAKKMQENFAKIRDPATPNDLRQELIKENADLSKARWPEEVE